MKTELYARIRHFKQYGHDIIRPAKVTLDHAPPSLYRRGRKNKRLRKFWIKIDQKWALANINTRLIGGCNIRLRHMTYSELCHHQTVDWDSHPFCPECYNHFNLPRCSKYGPLDCDFCENNSDATDRARYRRLEKAQPVRSTVSKDLPNNVYTQDDADIVIQNNKIVEIPNPAWLIHNQPNGTCFPRSLIPTDTDDIKAFARSEQTWQDLTQFERAATQYNKDHATTKKVKTVSDVTPPLIPKFLIWSEDDEYSDVDNIPQTVKTKLQAKGALPCSSSTNLEWSSTSPLRLSCTSTDFGSASNVIPCSTGF